MGKMSFMDWSLERVIRKSAWTVVNSFDWYAAEHVGRRLPEPLPPAPDHPPTAGMAAKFPNFIVRSNSGLEAVVQRRRSNGRVGRLERVSSVRQCSLAARRRPLAENDA